MTPPTKFRGEVFMQFYLSALLALSLAAALVGWALTVIYYAVVR